MSLKNKKEKKDPVKRDFTRLKTPHTYAIIFFAVVVCWILTFLIPRENSALIRSNIRTPTERRPQEPS